LSDKRAAWVTLKSGLKVLRLWESVGPKKPEIALLQLSPSQYKEFAGDPKAFLNAHHIFPNDVNKIVAQSALSLDKGYDDLVTDDVLMVLEHDPTESYVEMVSMPMFKS